MKHIPVLLKETLEYFSDTEIKVFFEGTMGAGGHAKAILEAHPEIETYIGVDRDGVAHELAGEALAPWADKIVYVRNNFAQVEEILEEVGVKQVDGFFLTWECRRCRLMKKKEALVSKRKEI
jgi:16S rRNA (cytosine1402-N4)-methyltransferase